METSVSVVTIFLDEERFIREAIESVCGQTYRDWELLLVDDGSSDRSAEIANGYVSQDPRIRYLTHPNGAHRGNALSRNLGIAEAHGEFIAFLDADDVWPHDALERLVKAIVRWPGAAMVYGSSVWWTQWSSDPAERPEWLPEENWVDDVAEHVPHTDIPLVPPELAALLLEDVGAVPCPCSMVVRTDAIRACGGFPGEVVGIFDDQALYFKIALEWPVVVTADHYGLYRQHREQRCLRAARDGSAADQERAYVAWLRGYVVERGCSDERLNDAIEGRVRSVGLG